MINVLFPKKYCVMNEYISIGALIYEKIEEDGVKEKWLAKK